MPNSTRLVVTVRTEQPRTSIILPTTRTGFNGKIKIKVRLMALFDGSPDCYLLKFLISWYS